MFKRFASGRRAAGARRRGSRRNRAAKLFLRLRVLRRRPGLLFALGLGLGVILAVALMGMRDFRPLTTVGPESARPQIAQILDETPPVSPVAAQAHTMAARKPAIPARAETGMPNLAEPARPAWQQYALAVPASAGRAMIAIVIDDMGLDKADSARVIALPGPVTIAFMTYASQLEDQARAARAAGHELWLHVPMEPLDGELDAGPNALKTGLPVKENRRRLDWALSRMAGYVGINNHMGSRFTSSEADMQLVLQAVRARGLAFLDSRTTASTVAGRMAAELGVPHIDRDVFIDNDETVESVLAQLAHAERIAEKRGYALAIGHPHATTIAALSQWLPTLKAKGLVLVPASALIRLERPNAG